MSETAIRLMEITFNIAYLITVWGLFGEMARRRSTIASADRPTAQLVRWAFGILALGDTGHVGFRVLAYALGDLALTLTVGGREIGLVGLGSMATAFTVTLFYVLMLYVWRARWDRTLGVVPPKSVIRSLPLTILSLVSLDSSG
jgi:hypothetical protein